MTAEPSSILTATDWRDYRLLDSGHGRKLEEVGGFRFIRPEPQAFWRPHHDDAMWREPSGIFEPGARDSETGGKWALAPDLPAQWPVHHDGLSFLVMPTPFRHFGFFPEQSVHWRWCDGLIRDFVRTKSRAPQILNLFGYTGIASLYAARSGAGVVHVDSSRKAINYAFANRDHAGMMDAPIRFITEDARAFVAREQRRDRRYDGVILDPPKYGRGPKGEVWRMDEDIAALMMAIRQILSDEPLFVVLTSYAIRASFLSLYHLLGETLGDLGGTVDAGELAIQEDRDGGRRLGQAIFARWQAA